MGLWLPRGTYADGFAEGPAESAYPDLWRGLVFCSSPHLGPTGLTLFDHSGYGNNGEINGTTAADAWVMSERGWVNDYGITAFIDIGDPVQMDFGSSGFTIVAKIRLNILATSRAILIKDRSNPRQFILQTDPSDNDELDFIVFQTNTSFKRIRTTASILVAISWLHIVATSDGAGNLKIYVDGARIPGTISGSSSGRMQATNVDLIIGANDETPRSKYFNGQIDGVLVYDRLLAPDEIMDMYLGAHPLTPIRGVVGKVPVSLLLRLSNMDGGMENLSGGFA